MPQKKLSEKHGGQGIPFFKPVQHEHSCIKQAGQKRQKVSQDLAGGQTVKKETQDPGQDKSDRDSLGPVRLVPEKQKTQQDDPDRCRILQNDRVPCRRQLICDGKKGRDTGHADRSCQHCKVPLERMLCQADKSADHTGCDQISHSVDRQRIPGDHLD